MQLIRGLPPAGAFEGGQALTVGTYDGLHLGHQALLGRLREHARRLCVPTLMVNLRAHAAGVPDPRKTPPARLTSLRERWRCLEPMQLDRLCVLRFGTAHPKPHGGPSSRTSWPSACDPRSWWLGHDFRFGRGGGGTAEMLHGAGQRLGFEVDIVAPVTLAGERLSSSAIREALAAGDLGRAERLLGRPYTMIGAGGARGAAGT